MFYGPEQAEIHDARFGDLAREAADLVLSQLDAAGLVSGTVVDLGCGSGIFARSALDRGYEVVGVDISADMISRARAHAPEAALTIGSVHDFELPACVAVVALGEVLNYATDPTAGLEALAGLAERAHAALRPGGTFVFDISTPGRGGLEGRRDRFHDETFFSLGMRSVEHDGTLERAITIFTRNASGVYERVDESHVLRLYDPADVVDAVTRAGFAVEVRDSYTDQPADFPGWKVFISVRQRGGSGTT